SLLGMTKNGFPPRPPRFKEPPRPPRFKSFASALFPELARRSTFCRALESRSFPFWCAHALFHSLRSLSRPLRSGDARSIASARSERGDQEGFAVHGR